MLADISLDHVRELQSQDMFYHAMRRYKQYGVLPRDRQLGRKLKTTQDRYVVENDLLYHIWIGKTKQQMYKQLCIPKSLRPKVL